MQSTQVCTKELVCVGVLAASNDYRLGGGGAEANAQWLRAYLVPAEDLGSIPNMCMEPHNLWDLTLLGNQGVFPHQVGARGEQGPGGGEQGPGGFP